MWGYEQATWDFIKKYGAAEMILSLDIALHLLSGKRVPIYSPPAVYKEGPALYKLSGIEN